ncbi:MAG: hypothetical protein QNJ63_21145 [Calothrix sp. MO_192.B10]|nr:hypothetical protein [Calothrix sp. MO_192.B10]
MSEPTRRPQPIILIRGFGGFDVSDEIKDAYQGFNHGTVYPQKRGENYIYEGLILRFLKSRWRYHDATNIVGYYNREIENGPQLPQKLHSLEEMINNNLGPRLLQQSFHHHHKSIIQEFKRLQAENVFSGNKIVIDPEMALYSLESIDLCRTLWVFRYYDLHDRCFDTYGQALVRLIELIRELVKIQQDVDTKVNIIAHSMGGLLVREVIQRTYPNRDQKNKSAEEYINKIVTLGTPHQGITFQLLENWMSINAQKELKHFHPDFQQDSANEVCFGKFHQYFPPERLLTVVGTNYRDYNVPAASFANRLFSVAGEYGPNYNRSDGLVKQTAAQIPGAPRTFIHKCHYGNDSLVTSREAFEIATRFFFGNVKARLGFVRGKVTRGKDVFGKSEFFLGVCIKPRRVDFELFHQSKEAENCYGPFCEADPIDHNVDFRESNEQLAFPWAGEQKLIWEGYFDTAPILEDASIHEKDLVMRMDFYVSERDLYGIGFSDNIVCRQQRYIRVLLPVLQQQLKLYFHQDERFNLNGVEMKQNNGRWEFTVEDSGFEGTFWMEIDFIPDSV